jgi:outer membrane immunogenic protein
MKRFWIAGAFALLIGGPALAADLPPPPGPMPRAPATYVPAPVPYYNWGGIYIGINGGGAFGNVTPGAAAVALGASNFSTRGFLVGPTVGFNYQVGAFVFGIEGDWDYSNTNGAIPGGFGTYKDTWLATARGRVGYAWDRVLLFATAGGAFENVTFPGSGTTPIGWTVGGGIEFAFAQNWSAKAEYLFVDFQNVGLTNAAGNFSAKETDNIVRAGVNYKFNF